METVTGCVRGVGVGGDVAADSGGGGYSLLGTMDAAATDIDGTSTSTGRDYSEVVGWARVLFACAKSAEGGGSNREGARGRGAR